ncbi:putative hybrid sensor histidine kinase/response regulator [Paratrimastix pyriformis]|uniref:Hybrid sensor histidine kinase/response regulator n=1 Tax=Paratrimastix pyriformis TaxID=342808 RepID=A0ABQ8U4X8_9EUKA|nr:putative hybrid sensor histidine kinase/response regulator [Paratrimastix pyriformis]
MSGMTFQIGCGATKAGSGSCFFPFLDTFLHFSLSVPQALLTLLRNAIKYTSAGLVTLQVELLRRSSQLQRRRTALLPPTAATTAPGAVAMATSFTPTPAASTGWFHPSTQYVPISLPGETDTASPTHSPAPPSPLLALPTQPTAPGSSTSTIQPDSPPSIQPAAPLSTLREVITARPEETGPLLADPTMALHALLHYDLPPPPTKSPPPRVFATPPMSRSRKRPVSKESQLRFTVADPGCGISPEKLAHLFTPFGDVHQGPGVPPHLWSNGGLGLPTVAQLIKLMDGDITVTSEVGRGSVFSFTILAEVDPGPHPAEPPSSSPSPVAAPSPNPSVTWGPLPPVPTSSFENTLRWNPARANGGPSAAVDAESSPASAVTTPTPTPATLDSRSVTPATAPSPSTHCREWSPTTGITPVPPPCSPTAPSPNPGTPSPPSPTPCPRGTPTSPQSCHTPDADIPPEIPMPTAPPPPPPPPPPPAHRHRHRRHRSSDSAPATSPPEALCLPPDDVAATLPSAQKTQRPHSKAQHHRHEASGQVARHLRILVAEDEPTNRLVVRQFLRRLGYVDVVEVVDGAAAVHAAASEHFDVILMDIQMPVMNGIEATRAILAAQTPNSVRPYIAAMTAGVLLTDRERCFEAGMNDFIAKPYQIVDLERTLRDAWNLIHECRKFPHTPPLCSSSALSPGHPVFPPLLSKLMRCLFLERLDEKVAWWDLTVFFLAALSTCFMVIELSLAFYDGKMHESSICEILKCLISGTTAFLEFSVVMVSRCQASIIRFEYYIAKSQNFVWRSLWKPLVIEMIICALHVPPFVNQWIPDRYNIVVMLRLYTLVRLVRDLSSVYRERSVVSAECLQEMHARPRIGTWGTLKARFNSNATAFVFSGALGFWLALGYAIYVFEREKQPDVFTLPNALWYAIVTMSTVGYGDYVPRSTGARILAGFLIMLSLVLVSFVVTAATTLLQLNPYEVREGGLLKECRSTAPYVLLISLSSPDLGRSALRRLPSPVGRPATTTKSHARS